MKERLNHLSGSGDYAPYTNRWEFRILRHNQLDSLGPEQHRHQGPLTGHYGLVRTVTIIQVGTILLHVRHASTVDPGHPTTYTFSVPTLTVTGFAASTTTPSLNHSETFTATFTGGTAPFKCAFKFGDEESMTLTGSAGSCSVNHDYDSAGSFTAMATVRGAFLTMSHRALS